MKGRARLLLALLAFVPGLASAQETVTVAFWNVENLFDAEDDPRNPGDDEFLPGNGWTEERYHRKLGHLAEVIAGLDPNLLGLAEVENRRVLEDLVRQPPLGKRGWKIAHRESPDSRGIDVALLYREPFAIADEKADVRLHEIALEKPTRGVLEAKVRAGERELFVLVNHWPSRIGGAEATRDLRKKAAEVCRRIVCERVDACAPGRWADLLLMGDLNDDPQDAAVSGTLGATFEKTVLFGGAQTARYALFNPMFRFVGEGKPGTLYFRGKPNVFDQLVVSRGLLESEGFSLDETSVEIFATDAMKDDKGEPKRFRRVKGGDWVEGYSDHFPVRARLALSGGPGK
ncbi:MAG TPA: endonuclease/exonuclease/phosphatase family protein [Planctomycetota bacterium]|nr:endonuclease/exonuclease/phosphatase family protein [Planctomycetota bacterium]